MGHQRRDRVVHESGAWGLGLTAEFRRSDYWVMIAADKFLAGFDQPLLWPRCTRRADFVAAEPHLPRAAAKTPLVLDFVNDPADIQTAFESYYTEAVVERETGPNIVLEIAAKLAEADVYQRSEVYEFATAWFSDSSHTEPAGAVKPA